MHTSNSTLTKVLAIFLTFLLGFLTCAGALFGVGYYAYANISYNKLEDLGLVSGNTSDFVNPEAHLPLTDATVKLLITELSTFSSIEGTLTLAKFCERYGLTLSESFTDKLPDGVLNADIRTLFTSEGIDKVLDETSADYILSFASSSALTDMLKDKLAGKTLRDFFDIQKFLADIMIGELMGYTPIYENGVIVEWQNSDGEPIEAALKNIVDVTVDDFTNGKFSTDKIFEGIYAGEAMGYTPHYKEDGTIDYWTEEVQILDANGKTVDLDGDSIPDTEMKIITGINNGMANINMGRLIDENDSYNIEDAFADIYFGELIKYTRLVDSEGFYIDADGNRLYRIDNNGNYIDPAGKLISKDDISEFKHSNFAWLDNTGARVGALANKISNYIVKDVLTGSIKFTANEMTNGITIADVLDYTYRDFLVITPSVGGEISLKPIEAGEVVPTGALVIRRWYESDGETEVTGVLASIAEKEVSDMSNAVSALTIANVLGYYDIGEYEGFGSERAPVFYDFQKVINPDSTESYKLVRAGGLMLNFAHLTIDEMSDNDKVSDAISNVIVGDTLGYTEVDGVWYNGAEEVSGIMKNIVGLKVSEIDARVQIMTVADVLGYQQVNGEWYENGLPVTGIMKRLADARLNSLNSEVHKLYFGDIEGYTLCKEETDGVSVFYVPVTDDERTNIQLGKVPIELYSWCTDDGGLYQEATGITVKFANLKIDDMTDSDKIVDQLEKVTLKEVFPDNHDKGFLSLIDPETTLEELSGDGDSSLTNKFKNSSIQTFVNAGLLDFGSVDPLDGIDTTAEKLNQVDALKLLATPEADVKFDDTNGWYYHDENNSGGYDEGEALYGWRSQTISALISYIL